MTKTVWTDGRLDEEHFRQHTAEFDGIFGDIAPVAFACAAWQACTSPALTPRYVRWHPRVLAIRCDPNAWDGTLVARAQLAAPRPSALDGWARDAGWQDWPMIFDQYVHPKDKDIADAPYLRAALLVEAPVPFTGLPPAPANPDDSFPGTARRAVDVLAREIDELLAPIVERLETQES